MAEPFSFNIESTSFAGNQELLEDILEPETTTADPDKIEKKDTEEKVDAKNTSQTKEEKEDKKKELDASEVFESLLGDEEDETTDEQGEEKKELVDKKKKEPEDQSPDKDSEEEQTEDETEETTYESLSKDLYKLGIFSEDDEGNQTLPKTSQEFLEKWETEKRNGAMQAIDDFLGKFGDSYKEAFDAIFVKGVSPKEYMSAIAEIQDYSTMDLTNEASQERVIRDALKDQGFDQEDIDAEVEKLKNYGDMEETSKRYHKVLLKKQEKSLQQLKDQKEQQRLQEAQRDKAYAESLQSIINEKLKQKEVDGIPLTPKKAQQLYDYLYKKNWKLPSGELLTDFDTFFLNLKKPENHALKVKIGLLALNNFDLSTVEKKAIAKESNELFETLATKKVKQSKSPSKATTAASKSAEIKSWWS